MILVVAAAFAASVWIASSPERQAALAALIRSPVGLVVLFGFSAMTSATLILPAPGLALTALAATVADPLAVGVVAGAGQTVGELTGYFAGMSGRSLIPAGRTYDRLVGLMHRFGAGAIFVLAVIPNPVFDVAGVIAGAMRMRLGVYVAAAGAGKIVKNVAVAGGAAALAALLARLMSG